MTNPSTSKCCIKCKYVDGCVNDLCECHSPEDNYKEVFGKDRPTTHNQEKCKKCEEGTGNHTCFAPMDTHNQEEKCPSCLAGFSKDDVLSNCTCACHRVNKFFIDLQEEGWRADLDALIDQESPRHSDMVLLIRKACKSAIQEERERLAGLVRELWETANDAGKVMLTKSQKNRKKSRKRATGAKIALEEVLSLIRTNTK